MTQTRNAFHRLVAAAVLVALIGTAGAALAAPKGVVNVNTATAEQLQLLPRVGPAVAQRMLEYRKENGKFASLEDLMLVRGIGQATFEQLKPYVTLTGETSLTEKVRPPRAAESEGR
ncbi:MAG TPA: helix-hairpin-helix domain-containing protein [Thermoanaerobaculia bacterium]|nr:helix-hairpin-helix domain-containing protein [Thermoanaerobaculia bacterium]